MAEVSRADKKSVLVICASRFGAGQLSRFDHSYRLTTQSFKDCRVTKVALPMRSCGLIGATCSIMGMVVTDMLGYVLFHSIPVQVSGGEWKCFPIERAAFSPQNKCAEYCFRTPTPSWASLHR